MSRFIPNRTPCGQTRREFLWQVGGGFAGLALAVWGGVGAAQPHFVDLRGVANVGREDDGVADRFERHRVDHHQGPAARALFLAMQAALQATQLGERLVALEAATDAVTVNMVSPGYVWTQLVENQIPDTMKARGLTRTPGGACRRLYSAM